jgi:ligand-binding SRPBCC domain-containing protein
MITYKLEKESFIPKPVEEVFAFFSRAENLEKVTPSRLQFRILTELPIKMHSGSMIDYQLKIWGLPFLWRTEITVWDPPYRFVDIQAKGPYRKWIHEHRFEKSGDGTQMLDTVEYAVPGGWFAPIIHKFFIKKDLEAIFKYRQRKYEEIFNKKSS